ncbi:hypothetical protein ABPG75_011407 [Micractinium tetrahymenae]
MEAAGRRGHPHRSLCRSWPAPTPTSSRRSGGRRLLRARLQPCMLFGADVRPPCICSRAPHHAFPALSTCRSGPRVALRLPATHASAAAMDASAAASIAQIVDKARTSWLKNHEVLELLQEYANAGLSVCQEPPVRPEGGQLFLFDRRVCRFFRRDGHNWRKKPDGKTIRETHEKLKVGNTETLNCYYAHADQDDGLQRRCYWQLDPEREHIVLVHYLCCASSRAGGGSTARAGSAELAEPRERPRRGNDGRRAYSPPAPPAGARGGSRGRLGSGSQSKLSPLAQSSGSLESSLPSQGLPEVAELADVSPLALPLVQGMSLEQAAALPSLAQQYALQQLQAQARLLNAAAVLPPPLPLPVDLDPFDLPADDLSRPHPGVLYTGQRMASQLAAAQQAAMASPAPPPPTLTPVAQLGGVAPAPALQPAAMPAAPATHLGAGAAASAQPLPPVAGLRALFPQESFTAEQHRNLFRQMSLGIQRDTVEEAAGYYLGSPTERSLDPLAASAAAEAKPATGAAASAADAGADATGGGLTGADLAALLSSPPHGSGHRRTFSRQGSGLSRLISKNWESELPMDMMLPDVDADISTYPVGDVVVEVAERPSSPSSRIFDQAGIAFLGSAGMAASTAHTLEPSPLAGLLPLRGTPAAALLAGLGGSGAGSPPRALPAFPTPTLGKGSEAGTPTFGSPPGQLLFAAGDGASLAQRVSRRELGAGASVRRDMGLGAGALGSMARSGSHPHLAHLSRRSAGVGLGTDATPEEVEAQVRRQERVEAAAQAAQGHRDEALAAARSRRAAHSSEEAEEEGMEMIDVPENMQRLSSFLARGRQTTGGQRELAAMAAEALELETRSLLKHMSIDEADAVAAVAAVAKGLEVMPTIDGSSELEATASGAHSMLGSLSEELASSRDQSVSSLLEGGALRPAAAGQQRR